jgi:hypothetical protein
MVSTRHPNVGLGVATIGEVIMTDELDLDDCFGSEGDDRNRLSRASRLAWICDIWSQLDITGETGATDRATLDRIEREVTDALYGTTPDVDRAESLTFKALLLISGDI